MYQRSKIQEESLYYEHRKMTGELPIIGVNTFLAEDPDAAGTPAEVELIRSTESEKQQQIRNQQAWKKYHEQAASEALAKLEHCAAHGGNIFVELMETAGREFRTNESLALSCRWQLSAEHVGA